MDVLTNIVMMKYSYILEYFKDIFIGVNIIQNMVLYFIGP
jgi:hypothetical protein